MKINILHMYYDLMNLYGEIGNIKAIIHDLEEQGIEYQLDNLTINDKINIKKYDFIYIGAGTENNFNIVKDDIYKYKNDLMDFIESGKTILATGNAFALFLNDNLNIFDMNLKQEKARLVGDVVAKCDFVDDRIIGFINQSMSSINYKNPMFEIIEGKLGNDGIHYNNFYGSFLLGPLLVRNPKFHEHVFKNLILKKDPKFKLKDMNLEIDIKAYNRYMDAYHKE